MKTKYKVVTLRIEAMGFETEQEANNWIDKNNFPCDEDSQTYAEEYEDDLDEEEDEENEI